MILHELAVVFSIGALCCAGGPASARRGRLASSALMAAAMLDATLVHVLPPLLWTVLLLAAALAASAGQRVRSGRARSDAYVPAGFVVMAVLLVAPGGAHDAPAPEGAHTHSSWAVLAALAVALGVLHVAVSAHRARRGSAADRGHHAAMGASTALMVAAVLA